jgi:hypothetical protein
VKFTAEPDGSREAQNICVLFDVHQVNAKKFHDGVVG